MNPIPLFSLSEFFIVLFYLLLLLFFVNRTLKKYPLNQGNTVFWGAWVFKVSFAGFFSVVYLYVLGGGDINAYWESAQSLNALFSSDPIAYLQEIWETKRALGISYHFNYETHYPPGWIWREKEAWNAAKLISVFSILTLHSFWATTLLISSLVFMLSWRLVYFLVQVEKFNARMVFIAFLFFPSVAFWCSGISKDSLVYMLVLTLIYLMFRVLKWNVKRSVIEVVLILFCVYLLFQLRHFLAFAILAPFIIALATRFSNRLNPRPLLLFFFRITLYVSSAFLLYYVSNSEQTQQLIFEANVTQSDFSQNPIYTGAKYTIENTDGSVLGLLTIFPQATFIGLYRPFITDNIGFSFLLNGLESTLLLVLSAIFLFNTQLLKTVRNLFRNEFALFSLTFILIVGFMAGYTSVLFGVLVRIRSIALPFLLLVITFRAPKENLES
ncbi:MAG: hypothetical protein ACKO4K_07665 [Flavobacteriales bacterium]